MIKETEKRCCTCLHHLLDATTRFERFRESLGGRDFRYYAMHHARG